MKLVRGMRVLVAAPWNGEPGPLLALRLVYRKEFDRPWIAVDKRGIGVADISLEEEGVTWVRGWTKTTERARALQAAAALS